MNTYANDRDTVLENIMGINKLNTKINITKDFLTSFVRRFTDNIDTQWIDIDMLTDQLFEGLPETVTFDKLYTFMANTCAEKVSKHPDYNKIAARVELEKLHMITPTDILTVANLLYHNRDKHGNMHSLISEKLYKIIQNNHDRIQKEMKMERDSFFDYFGLKTLSLSYLFKGIINGNRQIIERPQHMIMRVALGIHDNDLESAFETYNLISDRYFTHATPTLFNSGTNRPQLSSCFLLAVEDNIHSILRKVKEMGHISKWAGGIGVHLSGIRASGSLIRGTNGNSKGIIPLCILLNKLAKYIDQGGKRPGSIACFVKDTEVFTVNEGVKKIQDVKIGDMVITHKNRVRPITQVHKNALQDRKIYKLEVEKNKDIYVTGNHKFWSFHTDKSSLGWNSIEELKNIIDNKTNQTCYISTPSCTNIDIKNFKIDVMDYNDIMVGNMEEWEQLKSGKIVLHMYINDTVSIPSQPVNRIWNITEDLAKLFGMWLSNGGITKLKDNFVTGINFSIDEDNKDEIKRICNTIFGNTIFCKFNSENKNEFELHSRIVGLIFAHLFGGYYLNDKQLPNMVFSWPKNLVQSLIAGFITTIGYVSNITKDICIRSSNENLMNQLYHLCRNNGIKISFIKCDDGFINMNIPFCKDIIGKTHRFYSNDIIVNKQENDTFLKILNIIETDRKDEYVYTLGVEEDHSYTVEGLLAENCYLEPWHADIFEFCSLRKNDGNEDNRARDLFLALWIPDIFMERVENDGDWPLMCPDECPNLPTTHGEEFNKLFLEYESQKRYKKLIKARDLWSHILTCQIEAGFPYVLFKDSANKKSNQQNLGTIRSSNLCSEIIQYSDEHESSVCNLVSVCLPRFVRFNDNKPYYDFDKLIEVTKVAVRNLNKIININYYPSKQARQSNFKHRPIGIGIQGLADVYNLFEYPFESKEANELNKLIFETMYFAAISESARLAEIHGTYESFAGSPASKGLLQYHLWGLTENDLSGRYNWKSLIDKIKTTGLYNSLTTTLMPTAGTSQIMGCSECFEPYMSNIFVRKTKAGEYIIINENLVKKLIKEKLWSEDMRKRIIIHCGSIQNIDIIPQQIKDVYKTAFEIKLKNIIYQSAQRGPFIDQSQSMNLFMKEPDFTRLTSAHFYSWKSGLKTGMYYLRSLPAINPIQFGIPLEDIKRILGVDNTLSLIIDEYQEKRIDEKQQKPKMCKFNPKKKSEGCVSCSS